VEESQSLAENLGLVVGLDSETLLGIEAPTETLLQPAQDGFNHWLPQIAVGLLGCNG
jgi:hypothetical protein